MVSSIPVVVGGIGWSFALSVASNPNVLPDGLLGYQSRKDFFKTACGYRSGVSLDHR